MAQRQGQCVHPSAQIHHSCLLDAALEIGAFTVIGASVSVGNSSCIGPHCDFGDWRQDIADNNPTQIHIGNGVKIGARVSIYGAVEIGDDVSIGNNVTLRGPLQVGDRAQIFDGAVIGAIGQFPGRQATGGKVVISADVTIREYVVINQPVESTVTKIGRHAYVMARSQIDHDCHLGDYVKLATGVTLGGSVKIDDYAYLGMNCVVHQGIEVGAHTMLGMNGAILKNVPPFAVIIGSSFAKINAVGLSRRDFTRHSIDMIERFYATSSFLSVGESVNALEKDLRTIHNFYLINKGKPIYLPMFLTK
ncbi:DapH/DapD/GlmU-related protein [Rhizobium sp. L80/93]|uniref:DapH/DapD/GlmU-related protein n=1 Tax=Rhizobium sp. E27B/91 TaxID=2819995 RepID=UPI001ADC608B|nr:DapH/DapD/GlmU-related protein [Rhizobium sp. E27B/91]MBO9186482.1 hypothetical protein [Rhizobium sp. E27B/91]